MALLVTTLLISYVSPMISNSKILDSNYDFNFQENKPESDWEILNEAQKRALVDWERNSNSANSFVHSLGSVGPDEGAAIVVDGIGNAYVTGYFQITASFDNIMLGLGAQGTEIFVAKINQEGEWLWAIQAGGPGNDRPFDITLDSNGDVLITGMNTDSSIFGDL